MTKPLRDNANFPVTARTGAELAAAGLVSEEQSLHIDRVAARYATAITPALSALIDPNDPDDPIARQFIPDPAELMEHPEERFDPIGDFAYSPVEGIVHRHPDRVLLKLVSVCAAYCRFCFRREMVGPGMPAVLSGAAMDAALQYIRERPEIWEVVLTGGDPLMVSERRLRELISTIAAIEHVRVIRLHTRVPVAAPERITHALVSALKSETAATFVVLHANHPRELTEVVGAACARMIDAGIPMLSQSVLLRGVNDDVGVLAALMRAFVALRIKPYYLHHPDLAPGTAHFRLPVAKGQELMRALRRQASGICQPVYVLDIPDGHGKVPIGPNYIEVEEGGARVADTRGAKHAYPPAPAASNSNTRLRPR